MELNCPRLRLRRYTPADAADLAEFANDREVWRNLLDHFPHPYTLAEATRWLALQAQHPGALTFAIEVEGRAVGGIGFRVQEGVERFSIVLGYWLGRPYWGRGLATEAVGALVDWGWAAYPAWQRIQASVFGWNESSGRVLEKCGFQLEGRLRRAAFKDGEFTDFLIYAKLR